MACTQCGNEGVEGTCSMCYGDFYHNNDGWYLQEMMRYDYDLIDPGTNWCPDCGLPRGVCNCEEMRANNPNEDFDDWLVSVYSDGMVSYLNQISDDDRNDYVGFDVMCEVYAMLFEQVE